MSTPITITQIAETAGVGTATVDRVLNNRPGVNPATVERVQAAMQKLGANMPTRGRPRVLTNHKFAFVLPSTRRGVFDLLDRVIAQTAGDFRHQHITEVTQRLPVDDVNQFASQLVNMTHFDGLAVLAPDVPVVKLAINELVRAGVHVVTLLSDVAGSMRETYIGVDNRASGRTAGILLGHSLPHERQARCLLLNSPTRYAAEIDRSIGFSHLLKEKFSHIEMVDINDLPDNDEDAYVFTCNALSQVTQAGPIGAVHIVSPSSYGITRALQTLPEHSAIQVLAHDLIEPHHSLLLSGGLTYVLHQDIHYSVLTAAKVLRSLCEGVRGALSVGKPKLEIATVENLV
jgi:LacI family transcriptional regulator